MEPAATSNRDCEKNPKTSRLRYDDCHSHSDTEALVVGTTNMFDDDGYLKLIPAPSSDSGDPLNLEHWRKAAALACISLFGAFAISADVVIGGLIPVFILEYSGVDPRILANLDLGQASNGQGSRGTMSISPMAFLPPGVVPPPDIAMVALIPTVSLVANGVAASLLVPLSIAIGRRPILLLASLAAWAGSLWAGLSKSLLSHVVARVIQGFGCGAVEALVPLIVQDMVFLHQRHRAMSVVVCAQSLVVIGVGAVAPYVSVHYDWRLLYYVMSGLGVVTWLLLIGFLPETRWNRSKPELAGQSNYQPAFAAASNSPVAYRRRRSCTRLPLFPSQFEWRNTWLAIRAGFRSGYFPLVLWSVAAGAMFITSNTAAQQIAPYAFLAQGWKFDMTGLGLMPLFLAAIIVFLLSGPIADWVVKKVAENRGGRREAEYGVINLVIPFLVGMIGNLVFGWAVQAGAGWVFIMLGMFCIFTAYLMFLVVLNVLIVESYPHLAGPLLANVSSLRIGVATVLISQMMSWLTSLGALQTFVLYAEITLVLSLGLVLFWLWGKKIRMSTAGIVEDEKREGEENKSDKGEDDMGRNTSRENMI